MVISWDLMGKPWGKPWRKPWGKPSENYRKMVVSWDLDGFRAGFTNLMVTTSPSFLGGFVYYMKSVTTKL